MGGDMPINNYVSNGSFLYGEGNGVLGWELVNAEQTDGGLLLNGRYGKAGHLWRSMRDIRSIWKRAEVPCREKAAASMSNIFRENTRRAPMTIVK